METTIPCGRGHGNQALDGLRFSFFCTCRVQVLGTRVFHDVCVAVVAIDAFVSPFGSMFSPNIEHVS